MLKNKFYLNLIILSVMPVVIAGLIFLCGFNVKVPKGVYVNGIYVGGKSKTEASKLIREGVENELKTKTLKIHCKEKVYSFVYPEINYKDNVWEVLNGACGKGEYSAEFEYYLCGINEICAAICRNESIEAVEPYAKFRSDGQPFEYFAGFDGAKVDEKKLIEDIKYSLKGDFTPVRSTFNTVYRKTPMSEVKKNTRLLSSFTTYFDSGNTNRSHNIALAAAYLNGTTVFGGQTLSFNDIVGERSVNRGFRSAKIIEGGKYSDGVGGGVCQVSTTLYNAALLAGFKIEECHAHSLLVGYVPPSRDAMVSGRYCDLKIKNTTEYPLFIRAKCVNGSVTFNVYGRGDGATYSLSSKITETIPYNEGEGVMVKEGKCGTVSEGYLTITRGAKKEYKKIRSDKYAPIQPEYAPAPDPVTEPDPATEPELGDV